MPIDLDCDGIHHVDIGLIISRAKEAMEKDGVKAAIGHSVISNHIVIIEGDEKWTSR